MPDITFTPLDSSFIQGVHHDPSTNVLTVQMKSGTYQYYGVPASVHQDLLDADSAGQFFGQHIKPKYTCKSC